MLVFDYLVMLAYKTSKLSAYQGVAALYNFGASDMCDLAEASRGEFWVQTTCVI